MNEVELIRAQLSLERQHAAEVSHALSAAAARSEVRPEAFEAFRDASVDYLVWILSRFEEREQVFRDLVRSRFTPEDPARHTLEATFSLPGTSREALAKLEAALPSRPTSAAPAGSGSEQHATPNTSQAARWADFLLFFDGAWSARRDTLDKLFAQQAKVADWRAVSGIDADSIFDERTRYARVRATLPEGVELPTTTARA